MKLRQMRNLLCSLPVFWVASYGFCQSTAEDWHKAGYAAYQNKDYATALKDFKRSLQIDPLYSDSWNWLGLMYKQQGQYQQARDAFLKYLTLPNQPDKEGVLMFLGMSYEGLRQYDNAADTFCTLLQVTRQARVSLTAHLHLGHELYMTEQYDSALDELQKALSLEVAGCDVVGGCGTDSETERNQLGLVLFKLQRYSEALAAFQEAARLKPEDSDNYYNLGTVYVSLGRRAEAMAEYQKLLPMNKDDAADLYGQIQKMGNAPASPPPKQNIPPPPAGNPNASGDQCKSLVDNGDYANAIEVCKKAVVAAPFNADTWSNLGMAYFGSKHHSEAAQAYEQVIRLRPNDAHAHYGIGAAYEEMKQYDKAVPQLREAVRLDASNASQWYDLGQCLYLTGQYPAAAQALEKAANLQPNDSVTDYWLGRTYLKLEKHDQALAAYNRMIGPDGNGKPELSQQLFAEISASGGGRSIPRPTDSAAQPATNASDAVATFSQQCVSYVNAQDNPNAVAACKKTIELDRGNIDAYINLGATFFRMKRYADAMATLRQAVQVDPNSADAWGWLGLTHFTSDQLPEAVDALETSTRLDPTNAMHYEVLGSAYYAMGRKSNAQTIYRKLLATDRQAAEDLREYMNQIDDAQRKAKQQAN